MKRSEFCGPREPATRRLARLGLTSGPAGNGPRRVFRTKRYRRDLDEITLSRPYKSENDKT
jgi:hypothetical protein